MGRLSALWRQSSPGQPCLKCLRRRAPRAAIASLEFALITPILLLIVINFIDIARALLIRAQIHNAANAIVESAEKLSIASTSSGTIISQLTADQMQQAMSTIYAVIPGLNLGSGSGLFSGTYSVTLSSIGYSPTCAAAVNCGAQTAFVHWSSVLQYGGAKLSAGYGNARSCTGSLTQVAQFPDTALNYTEMTSPALANGASITLAPQLAADVSYSFSPWLGGFMSPFQVVASASLPAPVGNLTQSVAYTNASSPGCASGVCFCQ